jgi:hypothetical protein
MFTLTDAPPPAADDTPPRVSADVPPESDSTPHDETETPDPDADRPDQETDAPVHRPTVPTSDDEMAEIIQLRERGESWRLIGAHLQRPFSTCRYAYTTFFRTHLFHRPEGRPKSVTREVVALIIDATLADRRSSVRGVADQVGFSPETVKRVRHRENYHYYASVAVPPLDVAAKERGIQFCQSELARPDGLPITFTDDSMVRQDLNLGGIWRRCGELLEEAFYGESQHAAQVMVRGAIGENYRCSLLECPPRINGDSYLQLLQQNEVFTNLCRRLVGPHFWWQQDNAPPPRRAATIIRRNFHFLDSPHTVQTYPPLK